MYLSVLLTHSQLNMSVMRIDSETYCVFNSYSHENTWLHNALSYFEEATSSSFN